jgi:hypothetical protein
LWRSAFSCCAWLLVTFSSSCSSNSNGSSNQWVSKQRRSESSSMADSNCLRTSCLEY